MFIEFLSFFLLLYVSLEYEYCNKRIFVDNNALSISEIDKICNTLMKDDRYIILITTMIGIYNGNYFTQQAESFFLSHCNITKKRCDNNMAICIYLTSIEGDKGAIRIISGGNVKNAVSDKERQNIINTMIPLLKSKQYYIAIDGAIKELSTYFGSGFMKFLKVLFFIIIIGGIGFAIYYFYFKQKANLSHEVAVIESHEVSKEKLINDINDSYFPSEDSINNNSNVIHNHISYLINLISTIKASSPPILSIEKCLLCLRGITTGSKQTQQIEMNMIPNNPVNLNTNNYPLEPQSIGDNVNTRFGCMHVYHSECLRKFNLGNCLMCPNKSNDIVVNNYNSQVIDEQQIKNIIVNFTKLYTLKDLNDYVANYNTEFYSLNMEVFNNQLYNFWNNEKIFYN